MGLMTKDEIKVTMLIEIGIFALACHKKLESLVSSLPASH